MALDLHVTELTVDNHDQEEFLHLLHQAAVAIKLILHSSDFTDEERQHVRDWLQALRNHAKEDLKDRPDAAALIQQAVDATFLRINLTATGDEHTPAPGNEL